MKTKKQKIQIIFKTLIISVLMMIGVQTNLLAQDNQKVLETSKDTIQIKPSFWIGAAIGGNFNFYRGSTQDINADLFSYPAFHNGYGVGLFLAPTLIYHNPDKLFGVMLQAGYDNRKGKFDQISTPCDCPADLKTNLSYITIEPSLRIAPFKGNFYIYGGPRLAFNIDKSFTYNKGISADGTIAAEPELKGDFSNTNNSIISMHIGAGYDILLSSKIKGDIENGRTYKQVVLSPFADFHPYFGQNPRSIETWNLTTVRIGVLLKFGHVKVATKKEPIIIPVVPIIEKEVILVVIEPVPVVIEPVPVVVVIPVPIEITTSYTIYFKFDESNIDNQTINDLDNLINDLKNDPNIKIEIKSYADIRGSDDYNIRLSERRSNAIIGYLTNNNVDASRINSQGLGETTIFDKDEKINEINYDLNRRSNIIVITIIDNK